MGIPLCVICCFSLAAFNIYSLCLIFVNLINMCLGVFRLGFILFGTLWVSCRQHIQGSCFCIHSASLCLLVGTFNPFTFKVITDKYDPLPFTLLFWVRFYTPFLCFLSREYPLVFVGELVWWCRILSAFACLKSF